MLDLCTRGCRQQLLAHNSRWLRRALERAAKIMWLPARAMICTGRWIEAYWGPPPDVLWRGCLVSITNWLWLLHTCVEHVWCQAFDRWLRWKGLILYDKSQASKTPLVCFPQCDSRGTPSFTICSERSKKKMHYTRWLCLAPTCSPSLGRARRWCLFKHEWHGCVENGAQHQTEWQGFVVQGLNLQSRVTLLSSWGC